MKIGKVKAFITDLVCSFFSGATVIYASQSYKAKPAQPLVTMSFGDLSRVQHPPVKHIDGHVINYYHSKMKVQIDLYTKGAKVTNTSGGTIGVENTALSDMVDFANFLNSPYVVNMAGVADVTIASEGRVMDTTHVLNSSDFQFRATYELELQFTQEAVGYASMLDATSVRYPTVPDDTQDDVQDDAQDGLEDENAGDYENELEEDTEEDTQEVYIVPTFIQNPSGGGNEDVALELLGFFNEAEVTAEDFED